MESEVTLLSLIIRFDLISPLKPFLTKLEFREFSFVNKAISSKCWQTIQSLTTASTTSLRDPSIHWLCQQPVRLNITSLNLSRCKNFSPQCIQQLTQLQNLTTLK